MRKTAFNVILPPRLCRERIEWPPLVEWSPQLCRNLRYVKLIKLSSRAYAFHRSMIESEDCAMLFWWPHKKNAQMGYSNASRGWLNESSIDVISRFIHIALFFRAHTSHLLRSRVSYQCAFFPPSDWQSVNIIQFLSVRGLYYYKRNHGDSLYQLNVVVESSWSAYL